jgi:hypothetical protein
MYCIHHLGPNSVYNGAYNSLSWNLDCNPVHEVMLQLVKDARSESISQLVQSAPQRCAFFNKLGFR